MGSGLTEIIHFQMGGGQTQYQELESWRGTWIRAGLVGHILEVLCAHMAGEADVPHFLLHSFPTQNIDPANMICVFPLMPCPYLAGLPLVVLVRVARGCSLTLKSNY